MSGSGLMSKKSANREHLTNRSGGLAAEIGDLRADVANQIGPMAAFTVEEWTNPPIADVNAIKTAIASSTAAVDWSGTALNGVVGSTGVMSPPRNITVDNGGATEEDAPANAHFYGYDIAGNAIDEQVTIVQAGGQVVGAKAFARVTRITMPAGEGTGASLQFGFGALIGLSQKLKARAGLSAALMEIEAGVKVTTGVIAGAAVGLPNGTYAPANAPDGTRDYALFYEYDPTVL